MAELVSGRATLGTVELPQGARLIRVYDRLILSRETELSCPLPVFQGEHPLALPSEAGSEVAVSVAGWQVTMWAGIPPEGLGGQGSPWGRPEQFDRPSAIPDEPDSSFKWSAWLDRESLGEELSLRTRLPGDRFQPLGMSWEKKLQDFFTDAKVPRTWRDRMPLLLSQRGIAWVAGHRIADWAAIKTGELVSRPAVWIEIKTL